MILVDTSVWIDHLRSGSTELSALLIKLEVLMHPLVIGEVACGNLNNRALVLKLMRGLPQVKVATDAETLYFIEQRRLMGRGMGYIDAQLLAAAAMTPPCKIWTRDKNLDRITSELGLAWQQA
ncbi:MAG: type II toxin-antitoxin system VapC family toxin [Lysobacterales bacterium]